MAEGKKKEDRQKGATNGDTHNRAKRGGNTPIIEVEGSGTLPDDQHGENTRGQREVEWHSDHGHAKRIAGAEDSVLGEEEKHSTEGSGQAGSDTPGSEDLRDTVPRPVDTVGTDGCETDTDDTSDDAVSGGDGKTDLGGESQEERRTDEGAKHTQHQNGGFLLESRDGDDVVTDSTSGTGTSQDGTREFHDGGDNHSLAHGQGPRRNRGSEGVGDIVGTNVPCVQKRKHHAQGKDVIVLRKGSHSCGIDEIPDGCGMGKGGLGGRGNQK